MMTLLWKDYRQNRRLLAGVGILVLAPYPITIMAVAVRCLKYHSMMGETWSMVVSIPSVFSLVLVALTAGFVASSVMASERADRSAEFAAYLAIPRRSALASKCVLAIGVCGLMCSGVVAMLGLARWLAEEEADLRPVGDVVAGILLTGVCIFGVAWLLASLWGSPPIAAALGLATPVLLGVGLALLGYLRYGEDSSGERALVITYLVVCGVLGVGGFLAGGVHYLRQVGR